MTANFRYGRREYWHQTIQGLGFGGRPFALIRTETRALVWVPGYTAYLNRMSGSAYAEASMWSVLRGGDLANEWGRRKPKPEICSGGRLAHRLREPEIIARIDQEFGDGISGLIDPARTLILGQCDPFPFSFYLDPAKPTDRSRYRYIATIYGDAHPVEYQEEPRQ